MKRRRDGFLGPFYDYDQASTLTGYTPSYLSRLCDEHRLRYVVLTYFRGFRKRQVRKIPHGELERLMLEKIRERIR